MQSLPFSELDIYQSGDIFLPNRKLGIRKRCKKRTGNDSTVLAYSIINII